LAFPNPPRTWSAGETLTAANFNAQIRDALLLVPHVIPKTADQSVISSTVLIDDTHLQFSIAANEEWTFRFTLSTTGPGFLKLALNAPAGATGWHVTIYRNGGTDQDTRTSATFVDGETRTTVETPDVVYIDGYVLNGATPGTFKLRWAQASSNGTASIIKKGSSLMRRKV
jgi:hypothetical protein